MKKLYTKETMWQILEDYGVADNDEINLVTSINGYTEKTMQDILYARTGYRDFEQVFDWLENE